MQARILSFDDTCTGTITPLWQSPDLVVPLSLFALRHPSWSLGPTESVPEFNGVNIVFSVVLQSIPMAEIRRYQIDALISARYFVFHQYHWI